MLKKIYFVFCLSACNSQVELPNERFLIPLENDIYHIYNVESPVPIGLLPIQETDCFQLYSWNNILYKINDDGYFDISSWNEDNLAYELYDIETIVEAYNEDGDLSVFFYYKNLVIRGNLEYCDI